MCTCCFLGQKLSSLIKGVDLEIGIGIGIGRYQHKSTWYRYRNSKCGIAQHYQGQLVLNAHAWKFNVTHPPCMMRFVGGAEECALSAKVFALSKGL